jgi:hypothetical protein
LPSFGQRLFNSIDILSLSPLLPKAQHLQVKQQQQQQQQQ